MDSVFLHDFPGVLWGSFSMDFLLTELSNNSWQPPSRAYRCLKDAGSLDALDGIELSLDQAAPLMVGVEIPVLASRRIRHRSDLRDLAIQYPCQIRIPGAAGIGMAVSNRIDAIAACQTLFSRKVNGSFPDSLWVEADYSQAQQLSLAMVADEQSSEVILQGATEAQSLSLASLPERECVMKQVTLQDGFSPEGGGILAHQLGATEAGVAAILHLLEKLDILMLWAGLTACHLDAVALNDEGEIMPLRGRLTFAVDSPWRRQAQAAVQSGSVIHPAIVAHGEQRAVTLTDEQEALAFGTAPSPTEEKQKTRQEFRQGGQIPKTMDKAKALSKAWPKLFADPRIVRLGEGNIALISNGFHRTMATLDQCQQQGGSVSAFVNLQDSSSQESEPREPWRSRALSPVTWTDGAFVSAMAPTSTQTAMSARSSEGDDLIPNLDVFTMKRQLSQALRALARLREVKVILINWRSAQLPCRVLADALMEYQNHVAQQARRLAQPVSFVVCLAGADVESGYQRLAGEEIEVEQNLDVAIARSMGLARMARG